MKQPCSLRPCLNYYNRPTDRTRDFIIRNLKDPSLIPSKWAFLNFCTSLVTYEYFVQNPPIDTLSLLDELVQVFVFFLVQGAGCATGIHELLQNLTQIDDRDWEKPNTDNESQVNNQNMSRGNRNPSVRKQGIIPEFSCPLILCHWSASKAQKQKSSGSGRKVPAGFQPAIQPWTGDWRKCGWRRHWVRRAWGNWRGCVLQMSSAGLPLSLSWWQWVEEGCRLPCQCCLHHCCCCYCCHCWAWPWPWREGAGQSPESHCCSGVEGLASPEVSAAAPAPAVWGRCRLLLFLKPLNAAQSPSLGPSSA